MEITKDIVERICLDTMRTALNDYETIKSELNLIKTGQTVVMPVDKEHARCMLLLAMHYLEIKPGEPLTITKEENA